MSVPYNIAIDLESRPYAHYEGDHGAVSTIIHPNGTFVCSASTPFLAAVLRWVLEQVSTPGEAATK
ncbi:MAG: hypothetical protein M3404_01870 [Actinomycetota bacterium]|nr:hypothetical protein [Actinomycetota bacterium]